MIRCHWICKVEYNKYWSFSYRTIRLIAGKVKYLINGHKQGKGYKKIFKVKLYFSLICIFKNFTNVACEWPKCFFENGYLSQMKEIFRGKCNFFLQFLCSGQILLHFNFAFSFMNHKFYSFFHNFSSKIKFIANKKVVGNISENIPRAHRNSNWGKIYKPSKDFMQT